jgi:hypothetical protein
MILLAVALGFKYFGMVTMTLLLGYTPAWTNDLVKVTAGHYGWYKDEDIILETKGKQAVGIYN